MIESKDPIWDADWYSVMDITFKPLTLSNYPLHAHKYLLSLPPPVGTLLLLLTG
jgi:hypothetical protein